jgi:hypothetical protein
VLNYGQFPLRIKIKSGKITGVAVILPSYGFDYSKFLSPHFSRGIESYWYYFF